MYSDEKILIFSWVKSNFPINIILIFGLLKLVIKFLTWLDPLLLPRITILNSGKLDIFIFILELIYSISGWNNLTVLFILLKLI